MTMSEQHLDHEHLEVSPFCLSDETPTEEELYDLAELFKVFGDSTRIKILYALLNDDMSVGEIAKALSMTQSSISHQLRVLKQSRLVRFRREGKNIVYSLADDHVYTIMSQGLTHLEE
jgi:ArsR family transcriptional regulator